MVGDNQVLMATLQITSKVQIDSDELLAGLAQLKTPDLEALLSQANIILAKRKVPNLSAQESELLLKINQGLPEQIQSRYDELRGKLRNEVITSSEHEELLTLIDKVELKGAERLEHLIKLAQLREVSLSELMEPLEIKPPPPNR